MSSVSGRWFVTGLLGLSLLSGCGTGLVRLAKQEQWEELDRRARAQKRAPRAEAARAWAKALVALDRVDEARGLLLQDFRHGGQEASLLALGDLERERGLLGIAGAHYTRLAHLDLDMASSKSASGPICTLLHARAHAEAELGEALAADTDMRRVASICPEQVTDADRAFLSSLRPRAQQQVENQTTVDPLVSDPQRAAQRDAELRAQLELARKRGPRAVALLADAEQMRVEPDDVAVLLAAEFGGALGAGLVSTSRLSAWIGDNDMQAVFDAVDTLPRGVREYALLRLASVRSSPEVAGLRQTWIVAATSSLLGQGAHEAAKAWRVSASVGQLSGAEFALNTNLRDMIPILDEDVASPPENSGAPIAKPAKSHWSLRVPVDRRSFDLLLTLARLFEQRGQEVQALELRRAVLVAGYEVGLAQVAEAAVEEVRRQLIMGHPWQALAIAEVVPGPLLDEGLPALASAVRLARAAGLDASLDADQNIVWRSLGDAWLEDWSPRMDAQAGLDLGGGGHCPTLGTWLEEDAHTQLEAVGLDPVRSRAALEAVFTQLGAPATGVALVEAIESDLALSCSAPLVSLLHAGLHELGVAALDERLVHAPGLAAASQQQLHAEIALAHGEQKRAALLTITAAAQSDDPRELWGRAATAGLDYGAREYTIEALRQVLLHSDGLDDPAARRELALMRLRDVDADAELREGRELAVQELREQVGAYLGDVAAAQRWSRFDDLLWRLADEPRVDTRAWELLFEVLDPVAASAQHPRAARALIAAAQQAGAALSLALGPEPDPAPPAFLSDSQALCEATRTTASEELEPSHLLGAATACDASTRALALRSLLARTPPEHQQELRAQVLAGPLAFEAEPERPAIVHTVPALARDGLTARIVFELPLAPAWALSR